jgi:uncharacterized FAD-dependent dehydrogenase
MQQQFTLRLLPSEAANDSIIKKTIVQAAGKSLAVCTGFYIVKKSLDARGRTVWVNLTVQAFFDEPFHERPISEIDFKEVHQASKKVVIVGAGPAGLFAALKCIELGAKPIIIERGKDVRARRRDLAKLNKEGEVNPESNYCFGEGGAGTYSDGKLYTRSSKRGDVNRILQLFVRFGADERILYEAHPHIGTNKLPHIITAMRDFIIACGGEVLFEEKLVDFVLNGQQLKGITTASGKTIDTSSVILATGHSARDIYQLLYDKNILVEAKPFALGVRIEHPQSIIDSAQYHCDTRGEYLPPASYSLVQQVDGRGVFSFCMCPGGIIAPAATSPGELVVNGWSPSKRDNPYANSGMVVQVQVQEALKQMNDNKWKTTDDGPRTTEIQAVNRQLSTVNANNPLALMYFQQMVEQKAFAAGGGKMVAPAQRMADFVAGKTSASLPNCSYIPGLQSSDLSTVLPPFIHHSLQQGFKAFGQKMRGYFTNEAVVVATESRTSSPVRIPRNNDTLEHPQIKGLYPCAEGGGYAGGIVSAAMDGERVAEMALMNR